MNDQPSNGTAVPPLVVDLDGTLLRSDLLVESALQSIRRRPSTAFMLLPWLLAGKANLKQELAQAAPLDVTVLPYDEQVVAFIRVQKASGRSIVLATASHRIYAEQVAAHLRLFDRILATDQNCNLSSDAKRDRLVVEFGEKGFDYIGNSKDDLPVWAACRHAYLANPEQGVETRAHALGNLQKVITPPRRQGRDWIKAMRLHQWLKNLLIFVPLLASHNVGKLDLLLDGVLAFVLFGLCASSVYMLNDLFDLEDDRHHATKRHRPFAAGTLPVLSGLLAIPALLVAAFGGALWLLPWQFATALGLYYCITLAYSLILKRIMFVDVITLALLYTVRIIAGTFAFAVTATFWMLAFSMFIFLSLALVKRYTELLEARSRGNPEQSRGRGYFPGDLEMIASLGGTAGYMAVLVLALYIQDLRTVELYRHPKVIWLACPLLLYWISRTWLLAHRGQMHDDPVVFAIKDRVSLIVGVLFGAIFWFAA